jgi:transcriptional regulator with XRE-family HTH domain
MGLTFRSRPIDIGRSRARYLRQRFGEELRVARVSAGLSQSQLARLAGVSQTTVSAVERGTRGVTMEVACRLAAGCGCELGVRLFPADGVALRDSGQLAMAEAVVAAANPVWHARLEVPVSSSDRRAADLVLEGQSEVLHIEIERRLVDLQAQLRSATLKRDALAARYAVPVRLILALPDRRSTRTVVQRMGAVMARTLPIGSARIRRTLITGEPLEGDGILFWPEPNRVRNKSLKYSP